MAEPRDSGASSQEEGKHVNTCTYLEFTAPKTVRVASQELGALKDSEVYVETHCSAISAGTELKIFLGKFEQKGTTAGESEVKADTTIASLGATMGFPMRYGYCLVGTVKRCGPDCSHILPGTRVFSFQPHCSAFIARETDVMPIPDGLSFEDAVFLPSMETALSLVHDAAPRLCERVAILGQGIIGLLITALLTRGCFIDLAVFDLAEKRLAKAVQLADPHKLHVCGAGPSPCGDYDVCIEVTGQAQALQMALDKTRYGGRVVVGSWYGTSPVTLTLGTAIHRSHIELVFSQVSRVSGALADRWSKGRRLDAAWSLLRALEPSRSLVSHRVPLSQAQEMYTALAASPNDFLQVLFTASS